MAQLIKTSYYAVRKGRVPGIYTTWKDCLNQVSKFSGAEYKKFLTRNEAEGFMANQPLEIQSSYPILFTDGGSRENPGIAGCGAALIISGRIVSSCYRLLGNKITNNVAEYQGFLLGLYLARAFELPELEVRVDSKLVAKQVTGEWKVKEPNLQKLNEDAIREMKAFNKVIVKHVLREENKIADELANSAMDLYSKD